MAAAKALSFVALVQIAGARRRKRIGGSDERTSLPALRYHCGLLDGPLARRLFNRFTELLNPEQNISIL